MTVENFIKVYRDEPQSWPIFSYILDRFTYKKDDVPEMSIPVFDEEGRFTGDCDNFVLACREVLHHCKNVSYSDMRMIACKIDGEDHLTLAVRGDLFYHDIVILCNNQDKPRIMRELKRDGYTDFRRPLGGIGGLWVDFKHDKEIFGDPPE